MKKIAIGATTAALFGALLALIPPMSWEVASDPGLDPSAEWRLEATYTTPWQDVVFQAHSTRIGLDTIYDSGLVMDRGHATTGSVGHLWVATLHRPWIPAFAMVIGGLAFLRLRQLERRRRRQHS